MRYAVVLQLFVGLGLGAPVLAAERNAPAFTNPEEAGTDFQIQGEYLGTLPGRERDVRVGVQVIALGGGRFRAVGCVGGLPGAGWSRQDEKHEAEGELDGGTVEFLGENSRAEARDGAIHVFMDGQVGRLAKVHRTSLTLGAPPPAGAVVLFDGSSTDAWESGRIVEDRLLGATNVWTKEKFGDHQLHIEFRTPFMPESRGQGRGNSGVYVQSRYEVQILDSFGLAGRDNECGGIYSIEAPSVNMCFPPLSWQTFDIDFTAARHNDAGEKTENARVTVRHNGVVIHDNVELTQATPGRHREGPEPDSLFLQNHGNPVAFRNIWVVEK